MTLIRKRKLTDQQTRRLQKKQNPDAGMSDSEGGLEGVIVAHYGKQLEVRQCQPGDAFAGLQDDLKIWRCHARTHLPLLVTGDRVQWQPDTAADTGIITRLHPRLSLLQRPDRYHKLKPVAANVSCICIVFAPLPAPSGQMIDRYLVACELASIKPLLVLNKTDLADGLETARQLLDEYAQLGYDTLTFDRSQDIDTFARKIKGQTIAFVGQSGVGKSSIVNRLAPYAVQKINVLSTGSALGQHTTTTTRYIPFPSLEHPVGAVIDSPGIREFGLWHLDAADIRRGFVEFLPYYGQCRFRNCSHINEKGCALIEAVAEGKLSKRRLDSLNRLEQEARTASY